MLQPKFWCTKQRRVVVYRGSSPADRRQMNQSIFDYIEVHEDETVSLTLAAPFRELLSVDAKIEMTKQRIPVESRLETENPDRIHLVRVLLSTLWWS